MTKKEAIAELKKGNRVTHRTFSSDEFIEFDENGGIIDEKGIELFGFWNFRHEECFNDGWELA